MDYNTQREQLTMPEYGRNIQKMLRYIKSLPEKDKRSEQTRALVGAMAILNPQLKEMNDFKHKLWDHVFVIADFDLDIDAPYPVPTPATFRAAPNRIELETRHLKVNYYGRNIQNMIAALAARPQDEERDEMVKSLAYYMRKQYLIWNKDTVADQTIFKDIVMLSQGTLHVPESFQMEEVQGDAVRQSYYQSKNGHLKGGLNPTGHQHATGNNNNKRRKR